MEGICTPRVNFETMSKNINKKVLLICQLVSVDEQNVYVTTSDGGKVTIKPNGQEPYDTPFLEICGTVVDPQTIREEGHVNMGETFDMKLYDEFVKLSSNKYADAFQGSGV
jgi:replication factor A3